MSVLFSDQPQGRRTVTGLAVALLVVVAACLPGCRRGPVVVPVSGVVEVDGKPLASGAITVPSIVALLLLRLVALVKL